MTFLEMQPYLWFHHIKTLVQLGTDLVKQWVKTSKPEKPLASRDPQTLDSRRTTRRLQGSAGTGVPLEAYGIIWYLNLELK